MHVYFSGVGGSGIGPLALIAHQAGFLVSGSDKQASAYLDYLQHHGLPDVAVCKDAEHLAVVHKKTPVDWVVYSSALLKENAHHPVLAFAEDSGIKHSKRDEFLADLLAQKNLKLIAVAGTHGKTTTTAILVWLFKQLSIPVSYSVGAKLPFGEMGEFDPASTYFVYECDEYDRNFLSFQPYISVISGIDYDHPDIYPTRGEYYDAFRQFIGQSTWTIIWEADAARLELPNSENINRLAEQPLGLASISLAGEVNRLDARAAVQAVFELVDIDIAKLVTIANAFPGLSRRFEQITENVYSDYAHTPEKVRGALQMAKEIASDDVVVVYEGLHNTRQHFIKKDLEHLFDGVKKLYIVPSYLAREDESLEMLTPQKLTQLVSREVDTEPAALDNKLKAVITSHAKNGDLVVCLSAGGGGSLDEWLREQFI